MCLMICCLCGSCVLLCLAVLAVPVAYYHAQMTLPQQPGYTAKFVDNDQIENVLPLAPASYPEAFQGIIWMDQAGVYGHSDVPFSAPDLALSFGDTDFSTWDPKTRTLEVDVAGPGWTWMNKADGYAVWWLAKLIGYHYLFELTPKENYLQIYPSVNLGLLGKWRLPQFFMSFGMLKTKKTPEGACPPKAGTKKKDIVKCAQWDRITHGLFSPFFGDYGIVHYYVYQIVDGKGNRIQPYYDEYLSYAKSSCKPRSDAASLFGIDFAQAEQCPKSFVGVRAPKSPGGASTGAGTSKSAEL